MSKAIATIRKDIASYLINVAPEKIVYSGPREHAEHAERSSIRKIGCQDLGPSRLP